MPLDIFFLSTVQDGSLFTSLWLGVQQRQELRQGAAGELKLF